MSPFLFLMNDLDRAHAYDTLLAKEVEKKPAAGFWKRFFPF